MDSVKDVTFGEVLEGLHRENSGSKSYAWAENRSAAAIPVKRARKGTRHLNISESPDERPRIFLGEGAPYATLEKTCNKITPRTLALAAHPPSLSFVVGSPQLLPAPSVTPAPCAGRTGAEHSIAG